MPAPVVSTVVLEGLAFWERFGDGGNVLDARARSSATDAFVNRFPLYAPEFLEFQITFALSNDSKIVALAGCSPSDQRHPRSIGLSYVAVDPNYRNQGYSSVLCKAIVDYMKTKGLKSLDCSGYSQLGHERLRPVLQRVTSEAGIRLKDKDAVEYSHCADRYTRPTSR